MVMTNGRADWDDSVLDELIAQRWHGGVKAAVLAARQGPKP